MQKLERGWQLLSQLLRSVILQMDSTVLSFRRSKGCSFAKIQDMGDAKLLQQLLAGRVTAAHEEPISYL